MDWSCAGVASSDRQLIFMTASITRSIVTLPIDGVTYLLRLMDVQNARKIHILVQTRVTGNSNTLFKMAELLETLKDLFILLIFLCVRIEINSHWHDLLLNI